MSFKLIFFLLFSLHHLDFAAWMILFVRLQFIIDWNVRSNYHRVWWSWTFWIIHQICQAFWIFLLVLLLHTHIHIERFKWNLCIFLFELKKFSIETNKNLSNVPMTSDWKQTGLSVENQMHKIFDICAIKSVSHSTLQIVQFQVQAHKQINTQRTAKTLTKIVNHKDLSFTFFVSRNIQPTPVSHWTSLDTGTNVYISFIWFLSFFFIVVWLRFLYTRLCCCNWMQSLFHDGGGDVLSFVFSVCVYTTRFFFSSWFHTKKKKGKTKPHWTMNIEIKPIKWLKWKRGVCWIKNK